MRAGGAPMSSLRQRSLHCSRPHARVIVLGAPTERTLMHKVVVDFPSGAAPGTASQVRIEGVLALVMDGLKHAVERSTATTGDKDGPA